MALKNPEQEKLLLKIGKKKSKYRNTKVELDGIKFDSIAEAAQWIQLKEWKERKLIRKLEVKPVYKFRCGVKYIPDFRFKRRENGIWKSVILDVKGFVTPEFSVKRKLMLDEFGIVVEIVKISSNVANNLVRAYIGKSSTK